MYSINQLTALHNQPITSYRPFLLQATYTQHRKRKHSPEDIGSPPIKGASLLAAVPTRLPSEEQGTPPSTRLLLSTTTTSPSSLPSTEGSAPAHAFIEDRLPLLDSMLKCLCQYSEECVNRARMSERNALALMLDITRHFPNVGIAPYCI